MKRKQAIEHFGSISALAKALDISYEAVRQWGDQIPELRQYQLERITEGKLVAETGVAASKNMTNHQAAAA